MLLLTSIDDTIQLGTSTAADIHVLVSCVDRDATTDTHTRISTIIASPAADTIIVTAPAASIYRNIRGMTIINKHASTSNVVTINYYDDDTATTIQLYKATLLPGYQITFYDGEWNLLNSMGSPVETSLPGTFLRSTFLTVSGTFTTGLFTNTIVIRGVGGGAAGGGVTNVSAQGAAAGGGGGGGYAEKKFTVSPNTAYTYTVGAAGAGVSGAAGGNGTNSTFIVGATTVTAFGGTGGLAAAVSAGLTAYGGGAGGVISTNGDFNCGGQPGRGGVRTVTTLAGSGAGGASAFGAGGAPRATAGTGNAAIGFGAGGGGGLTHSGTARVGGAGTAGCWFVEEYT